MFRLFGSPDVEQTVPVIAFLARADGLWKVCRASWLLFYIIEAVAVYSVLKKYPNDAEAAVRPPCNSGTFSDSRILGVLSRGLQALISLFVTDQARAVGQMVTLPKKMLPVRLQLFKQLLLKGTYGLKPLAATAVAEPPTTMSMPFP